MCKELGSGFFQLVMEGGSEVIVNHIYTGERIFPHKDECLAAKKNYICSLHILAVTCGHTTKLEFPNSNFTISESFSELTLGSLIYHVISLKKLPCAAFFVSF